LRRPGTTAWTARCQRKGRNMPVTQVHRPGGPTGHHVLASIAEIRCVGAAELVRPVRNFIQQCALGAGACEEIAHTAKLLTSELVSNVVRHTPAGTAVRVEVLRDAMCDHLVVGVEDSSSDIPVIPGHCRPVSDDESGWGLPLLMTLADECGAIPLRCGKRMWFALSLA
jgi:anti-sigma regulatory factor (Ser/Thr protein kinase)